MNDRVCSASSAIPSFLGLVLAACVGTVGGPAGDDDRSDGGRDPGAPDGGAGSGRPDAGPGPSPVGTAVAVVGIRDTGGGGVEVPVTFAHVFAPGAVRADQPLVAELAAGQVVALQTDAKAWHADGSLRHAVFSLRLPSLASGATQSVRLVIADRPLSGSPVDANGLVADGFEAAIQLNLGGTVYEASASTGLVGATAWLEGPVVSEWLVTAPFVARGQSTPHPHLTARFAVRAYAGFDAVRVSANVENNWAYQPSPQRLDYDAAISIDGVQQYARAGITHYRQARWRRVLWRGGADMHVEFDPAALVASGAVPSYDVSLNIAGGSLDRSFNALNANNTGPMGIALMEAYMPATGAHDDIGPLSMWAARDLISQDPRARAVTLATGDAGGSWSIHYRDQNTDLPLSVVDYPYSTLLGNPGDTVNPRTGQSEAFPACASGCGSPYADDTAHQPSIAYLPYLYTGDYYYLEELQFWAAYNMFSSNPGYRGYEKGLVKPQQVRGQAWSLRTLGYAAFITPDQHPYKQYLLDRLHDNLDWYNRQYATNASANQLGVLTQTYVQFTAFAGWMDDFFTWSAGQLVAMGFDEARPIAEYKARFPVGRMTGPDYCYLAGAPYHLVIAPTENATAIFGTFAEMYRANAGANCSGTPLYGLACDSPEMAQCLGRPVGDMGGYAQSPTGYPSNLQPALAVAADLGIAGAAQAWSTFAARAVKPDYTDSPQFAVVPRPR